MYAISPHVSWVLVHNQAKPFDFNSVTPIFISCMLCINSSYLFIFYQDECYFYKPVSMKIKLSFMYIFLHFFKNRIKTDMSSFLFNTHTHTQKQLVLIQIIYFLQFLILTNHNHRIYNHFFVFLCFAWLSDWTWWDSHFSLSFFPTRHLTHYLKRFLHWIAFLRRLVSPQQCCLKTKTVSLQQICSTIINQATVSHFTTPKAPKPLISDNTY